MEKKELTIQRTFDAPRERLWQAWTDPEQVREWWAPRGFTNPTVEIDPRVGGSLFIVMQAGENMGQMSGMKAPMKGVFTAVDEPERLTFSNSAVNEAGDTLLTGTTDVAFEDAGGKTKMTVRTNAEGDAPGTDLMLAGMEQGWNEQCDKLAEFLQTKI